MSNNEKWNEEAWKRLVMPQFDLRRYRRTWPWYKYLEKRRNWAPLVAGLHKETESPGELTEYFRRCLVAESEWMVPNIEKVVAGDPAKGFANVF